MISELTLVLPAFVLSASAEPQPPIIQKGASVKFNLHGTELYIGTADASTGAQLSLAQCNTEHTTFELPGGAPNPTQIVLSGSTGPILCVAAGQALDGATPVALDACSDEAYSRWMVQFSNIISYDDSPDRCLSPASGEEGAAVVFGTCASAINNQFDPIVVAGQGNCATVELPREVGRY